MGLLDKTHINFPFSGSRPSFHVPHLEVAHAASFRLPKFRRLLQFHVEQSPVEFTCVAE